MKANVAPAAFASARSSAFAARIAAWLSRMACAIAESALSRCAAGLSASVRAAALARRPISAIAAVMLLPSMDFSGAALSSTKLLRIGVSVGFSR